MSNVGVYIPARLGSTRLKEKMLLDINGTPLIRVMYDNVSSFGYPTKVITDSERIAAVLPEGSYILSGEAENGTARIASVLDQIPHDLIINVQGDMLGITKEVVDRMVNDYSAPGYSFCAVGYKKGYPKGGVKILHQNGHAIWFTRTEIGYGDQTLGIYAYRRIVLQQYHLLKGCDNKKEDLEQCRIINYFPMKAIEVPFKGIEIDFKKDVEKVARLT